MNRTTKCRTRKYLISEKLNFGNTYTEYPNDEDDDYDYVDDEDEEEYFGISM